MDRILYTTGAYLYPQMFVISGQEIWVWVVSQFVEDSYQGDNRGDVCNPPTGAETREKLMVGIDDDDYIDDDDEDDIEV